MIKMAYSPTVRRKLLAAVGALNAPHMITLYGALIDRKYKVISDRKPIPFHVEIKDGGLAFTAVPPEKITWESKGEAPTAVVRLFEKPRGAAYLMDHQVSPTNIEVGGSLVINAERPLKAMG